MPLGDEPDDPGLKGNKAHAVFDEQALSFVACLRREQIPGQTTPLLTSHFLAQSDACNRIDHLRLRQTTEVPTRVLANSKTPLSYLSYLFLLVFCFFGSARGGATSSGQISRGKAEEFLDGSLAFGLYQP